MKTTLSNQAKSQSKDQQSTGNFSPSNLRGSKGSREDVFSETKIKSNE